MSVNFTPKPKSASFLLAVGLSVLAAACAPRNGENRAAEGPFELDCGNVAEPRLRRRQVNPVTGIYSSRCRLDALLSG